MVKVSSFAGEAFLLDSGNIGVKLYGKYTPNLLFIIGQGDSHIEKKNDEEIYVKNWWDSKDYREFNLPQGDLCGIVGTFFTSKKGTKIFRIEENGPHILLRDDWGGCFNDYRGGTLPDESQGALYHRRASSNGGGSGYDYAVVPKDWRLSISEDDL